MPDPKKQASSRKQAPKPVAEPHDQTSNETRDFDDPVNEASEESFPASDAPAWTETAATKNGN